jgi:hypothetical protein
MRHEGDGRLSKSIWSHEPILTPERKLWRAVLEQAYADAELPAHEETGFEPVERKQARRFLRADSPHEQASLELVCEFADVPADRVILWARRRYPIVRPGDLAA